MTRKDARAFAQEFTRLALIYERNYGDEAAAVCQAYFEALAELPLQDVIVAARALVKHSRYLPRPSEWREAAVEALTDRRQVWRIAPANPRRRSSALNDGRTTVGSIRAARTT